MHELNFTWLTDQLTAIMNYVLMMNQIIVAANIGSQDIMTKPLLTTKHESYTNPMVIHFFFFFHSCKGHVNLQVFLQIQAMLSNTFSLYQQYRSAQCLNESHGD